MKSTQFIHTTTLCLFWSFFAFTSANPAALKAPNVPFEILEPNPTIEKQIPYEEIAPIEPIFRRSTSLFRSERERNIHTINSVIQSLTQILRYDNTRSIRDGTYQQKQFVMPALASVRGSVSIIMDLKEVYWSLVRNDGNTVLANSRLQDLLLERLLVKDNHRGIDSMGDIDHTLKQTYEMLYQVRGEISEAPLSRKQKVNSVRQELLRLRTPIVQALYTYPLRIQAANWLALNDYLKSTTMRTILASNSQYADEILLMDIFRGLKTICERAKELTEQSM